MNGFIRAVHRLCRKPRTLGFGIQSPFAYHFVTGLVHETLPYYGYDILLKKYPTDNAAELKLCRLLLRLSNYIRPVKICICTEYADMYADYLRAGCLKAEIVDWRHVFEDSVSSCPDIFLLSIKSDWRQRFDMFVCRAKPSSVLVVPRIYTTRETISAWEAMVEDDRTGVTFDLWDCGVIFFDKKQYKRNYKINL